MFEQRFCTFLKKTSEKPSCRYQERGISLAPRKTAEKQPSFQGLERHFREQICLRADWNLVSSCLGGSSPILDVSSRRRVGALHPPL